MYGSMEADMEVQRTIKRAELTAYLCVLKKVIGPIKVHVSTTKEPLMGYGEERGNTSIRNLVMLTSGSTLGKNCTC